MDYRPPLSSHLANQVINILGSIYHWLEGNTVATVPKTNLCDLAINLTQFLIALQNIDATHATKICEIALTTTWHNSLVWVHNDISAENLLVQQEQLSAVIDFGQLAIGHPAYDLMIAWTLFKDKSRETFRTTLSLDADT